MARISQNLQLVNCPKSTLEIPHFHYCITLPIIRTVLKNVDRTVNFYYCTALPIIRTVLKNQACNIYKYWSYNRNLRVSSFSTFDVTNCFCNVWQKKSTKKKCLLFQGTSWKTWPIKV